MNKNEPKKSPAGDFFAWLHFTAAKRNPDIYVNSTSSQKEIFRAFGLSPIPLQGFFLNAFAAFARGGSQILRPGQSDAFSRHVPQVQKIPATILGKTTRRGKATFRLESLTEQYLGFYGEFFGSFFPHRKNEHPISLIISSYLTIEFKKFSTIVSKTKFMDKLIDNLTFELPL